VLRELVLYRPPIILFVSKAPIDVIQQNRRFVVCPSKVFHCDTA
jgi:hypothetical protein